MPLPLWLIPLVIKGVAVVGGAVSAGAVVKGAVDLIKSNDEKSEQFKKQKSIIEKFEKNKKESLLVIDELGNKELNILYGFDKFITIYESISSIPKDYKVELEQSNFQKFNLDDLKKTARGSAMLLEQFSELDTGNFADIAAFGAAEITKETGDMQGFEEEQYRAILSNGILKNLTVMVTVRADMYAQEEYTKELDVIANELCDFLNLLKEKSQSYLASLNDIETVYKRHLMQLRILVTKSKKTDYKKFSKKEKLLLQNTVKLMSVLNKMCSINLVSVKSETEIKVNIEEIDFNIDMCKTIKEAVSEYGTY